MVGLDIGTCNIVSARQGDNGSIEYKSLRDAFLSLENDAATKNMLKMSKINFIEDGDLLYIVGDDAITMANIFKREVRRPLSKGVLAPGELVAEKILLILLENVIGKAKIKGETCFYSIPAAPVDGSTDIVYHSALLSKLVASLDYNPVALNEAAAIGYSNSAKEQFSSVNISCGAGMINVCLTYRTVIGLAFSINRSGDFLDKSAAAATGTTASRIQSIKERGINLMDPSEGDPKTLREREALVIYYKSLILNTLNAIRDEFLKSQGTIDLPMAIPMIIGGGTSLAKNFKELFIEGFNTIKDKFPFSISEIRLSTNNLTCVAEGLLIASMNYDQKD